MSNMQRKIDDTKSNVNKKISPASFVLLAIIFLASLSFLYLIYSYFPHLDENEKQYIKLPRNIADAKNIGAVLKKYNQNHFYSVLAAFFAVYVFLQTFAIPGSIFLSILSGFLYPFPLALSLVCTCSALGATFCYFLSSVVARALILKFFGSRILQWQNKAEKLKDDMFWYIVFLRITPLIPNWFMNLASPIINIPLKAFAFGTFFGVAPPSLIYIQAGTTLNQLTSSTSVFSVKSVLGLVVIAILSLAPIAIPKLFPKFGDKYLNKFLLNSQNKSE